MLFFFFLFLLSNFLLVFPFFYSYVFHFNSLLLWKENAISSSSITNLIKCWIFKLLLNSYCLMYKTTCKWKATTRHDWDCISWWKIHTYNLQTKSKQFNNTEIPCKLVKNKSSPAIYPGKGSYLPQTKIEKI